MSHRERIAFWYPDLLPKRAWMVNTLLYEDGMAALLPTPSAFPGRYGPDRSIAASRQIVASELQGFYESQGRDLELIDRTLADLELVSSRGLFAAYSIPDLMGLAQRDSDQLLAALSHLPGVGTFASIADRGPEGYFSEESDSAAAMREALARGEASVLIGGKVGMTLGNSLVRAGLLGRLPTDRLNYWGSAETVDVILRWVVENFAVAHPGLIPTDVSVGVTRSVGSPINAQDESSASSAVPSTLVVEVPELPTVIGVTVEEILQFRERNEVSLKKLRDVIDAAADDPGALKSISVDITRLRGEVGSRLESNFPTRVLRCARTTILDTSLLRSTAMSEAALVVLGGNAVNPRDVALSFGVGVIDSAGPRIRRRRRYRYVEEVEKWARALQQPPAGGTE